MLTKEDLEAIGALIKAEGEEIRKANKSDLEANNSVLGTIFKVELASTRQELKTELASKKDVKRLEQKLDKTTEDHEERIGRLEDHTSIHKN